VLKKLTRGLDLFAAYWVGVRVDTVVTAVKRGQLIYVETKRKKNAREGVKHEMRNSSDVVVVIVGNAASTQASYRNV